MLRKLLPLFFLLGYTTLQGQLAFEGLVLDEVTEKPIPYVNIGIVDRGIGTISNENGEFILEFRPREVQVDDVVRISSLGYFPYEFPIDLLKEDVLRMTIRLKPKVESLDEVILTNRDYKIGEEVGYRNMVLGGIGYWKDSISLGGEMASEIRVREGLRKLNTLYFKVLKNPSDSIRLRVNIYDIAEKGKELGKNLNQSGRNIIHVLRGRDSLSVIDLKPYNIWTRDDFAVSLELLEVYGTETISLSIPAAKVGSARSFRRETSQDSWERMKRGVLGFGIQTTYYTDQAGRVATAPQQWERKKMEMEISGYVMAITDASSEEGRSRLAGAIVTNYTSNVSVETSKWGRYRIKIARGDIIGVSYPGMHTLLMSTYRPGNFVFLLFPKKN